MGHMDKIHKMRVTTGRCIVEESRIRYLEYIEKDRDWWNSPSRSDWVRGRFGPTLREKDGLTYENGKAVDEHKCNVCGEIPKSVDELILEMEFSFCDEYDCGMKICRGCVQKMGGLFATNQDTKE
jgi:hypothetical protein